MNVNNDKLSPHLRENSSPNSSSTPPYTSEGDTRYAHLGVMGDFSAPEHQEQFKHVLLVQQESYVLFLLSHNASLGFLYLRYVNDFKTRHALRPNS